MATKAAMIMAKLRNIVAGKEGDMVTKVEEDMGEGRKDQ